MAQEMEREQCLIQMEKFNMKDILSMVFEMVMGNMSMIAVIIK